MEGKSKRIKSLFDLLHSCCGFVLVGGGFFLMTEDGIPNTAEKIAIGRGKYVVIRYNVTGH